MLYAQWRWRGLDPVGAWRGDHLPPPPPGFVRGPWPARVDAFLTACANYAARRERDLLTTIEALAAGIGGK